MSRQIGLWVIAFVSFLACGAMAADAPAPLRVMSFNIRNSGARDGENAWSKRKDMFIETIQAFNPDLLGMQEVLPDQASYVQEKLSDYGYVGVGRDDGKNKGEASPVLWKKDRFEKLDAGQFWLSEHPEQVGVKGWDAVLPRICSWVKLKDKASGKQLIYLNAHWDHIGLKAREESGRLMRKMAEKLHGDGPVIITGDFNSTEEMPGYKAILGDQNDALRLIDSYREVHPQLQEDEASFHGFKGTRKGMRIDFILHSPELVARSSEIDHTQKNGHYPSDHYAVEAVLAWK